MSYSNAVPTVNGVHVQTAEGMVPLGPNVGKFTSILKGESAAAGAKTGDVAVIGPGGEKMPIAITNTELRDFKPGDSKWKPVNETLKFLRGRIGEQGPVGVPTTQTIDITNTHLGGGLKVPVVQKDAANKNSAQNQYYTFSETEHHEVDWRSILKQLPQDTFDQMIGQKHVVQLKVEPVLGSYDNARRHAHKMCTQWTTIPEDVDCPVWDFHVLLHDGSVWRFHPSGGKKNWPRVRCRRTIDAQRPQRISEWHQQ